MTTKHACKGVSGSDVRKEFSLNDNESSSNSDDGNKSLSMNVSLTAGGESATAASLPGSPQASPSRAESTRKTLNTMSSPRRVLRVRARRGDSVAKEMRNKNIVIMSPAKMAKLKQNCFSDRSIETALTSTEWSSSDCTSSNSGSNSSLSHNCNSNVTIINVAANDLPVFLKRSRQRKALNACAEAALAKSDHHQDDSASNLKKLTNHSKSRRRASLFHVESQQINDANNTSQFTSVHPLFEREKQLYEKHSQSQKKHRSASLPRHIEKNSSFQNDLNSSPDLEDQKYTTNRSTSTKTKRCSRSSGQKSSSSRRVASTTTTSSAADTTPATAPLPTTTGASAAELSQPIPSHSIQKSNETAAVPSSSSRFNHHHHAPAAERASHKHHKEPSRSSMPTSSSSLRRQSMPSTNPFMDIGEKKGSEPTLARGAGQEQVATLPLSLFVGQQGGGKFRGSSMSMVEKSNSCVNHASAQQEQQIALTLSSDEQRKVIPGPPGPGKFRRSSMSMVEKISCFDHPSAAQEPQVDVPQFFAEQGKGITGQQRAGRFRRSSMSMVEKISCFDHPPFAAQGPAEPETHHQKHFKTERRGSMPTSILRWQSLPILATPSSPHSAWSRQDETTGNIKDKKDSEPTLTRVRQEQVAQLSLPVAAQRNRRSPSQGPAEREHRTRQRRCSMPSSTFLEQAAFPSAAASTDQRRLIGQGRIRRSSGKNISSSVEPSFDKSSRNIAEKKELAAAAASKKSSSSRTESAPTREGRKSKDEHMARLQRKSSKSRSSKSLGENRLGENGIRDKNLHQQEQEQSEASSSWVLPEDDITSEFNLDNLDLFIDNGNMSSSSSNNKRNSKTVPSFGDFSSFSSSPLKEQQAATRKGNAENDDDVSCSSLFETMEAPFFPESSFSTFSVYEPLTLHICSNSMGNLAHSTHNDNTSTTEPTTDDDLFNSNYRHEKKDNDNHNNGCSSNVRSTNSNAAGARSGSPFKKQQQEHATTDLSSKLPSTPRNRKRAVRTTTQRSQAHRPGDNHKI